jgi:hypothetical protein
MSSTEYVGVSSPVPTTVLSLSLPHVDPVSSYFIPPATSFIMPWKSATDLRYKAKMKYDVVRLSLTPIYPYIPQTAPRPRSTGMSTTQRERSYRGWPRCNRESLMGTAARKNPRRKELTGGASRSSFEYSHPFVSLYGTVKTLFRCLRGRFHGLCASPMLSYV